MINGDITEFTDKLWSGEERIFVYNGKLKSIQNGLISRCYHCPREHCSSERQKR